MRRDGDFGIYTVERFERLCVDTEQWTRWRVGSLAGSLKKKMVGSKGNMDESERNRACDSGSKVGQVGLV